MEEVGNESQACSAELRVASPVLELPENWTDTRETLLEGMVFSLKYLGMTLVERPKGEELSAAAVKRIVATVSVQIPCAPPGQLPLPQLSLFSGRICVT